MVCKEDELSKAVQLQNEMLLVLLKEDENIFNRMEEDVLDYFTENVIEGSESEIFKEHYGGLFKNSIHCPYCGSAKHLLLNGFNPRGEVAYTWYTCKNCLSKVRHYEDGRVEISDGED